MFSEKIDTDLLKNRINIVDYIKQFVELQQNGKNYIGLCPFHKEDTPSFTVSEERQICHCFGCGITYDVIGFAEKFHKISFYDAVNAISAFAGESVVFSRILPIMEICKKYAPKKEEEEARKYFLKDSCFDGISFEPIKEWIAEGIDPAVLVAHKVGYDRVENKIVFPIYDLLGNIIALKKRTLDPDFKKKRLPKYIYSVPIGELDTFYWYLQNIENIYEKNEMIIFEGEKSVMKVEGWGVHNSIASMTSNLSRQQLDILLKTVGVKDIVVAFDKDKTIQDVIKVFHPLKSYKNIYIVRDFLSPNSLLGEKDAPCDKGKEVWEKLYAARERIRIW